MTRGAVPMIDTPAEEDTSTPSRKRRRLLEREIAASDSSSWNDLCIASPSRHRNSTPRQRVPRPASPPPGSRRRSAPIQLVSPVKRTNTSDYDTDDTVRQALFKNEVKDNSPAWLIQALKALRLRYPDDRFEARNGRVDCLDCARDYAGVKGLNNFENHVKSAPHRALVNDRLQNASKPQHYEAPKKFMDFEQHPPLQVFAAGAQPSTMDFGKMFFNGLLNDNHSSSIRVSFLDKRVADAEESIVKQREEFEESIETTREGIDEAKEKFNLFSEVLKDTAAKFNDQNGEAVERLKALESAATKWEDQDREVAERLNASETKIDESLKDMDRKIVNFEDMCTEKIEETNSRVFRNFQKASEQYDKVEGRIVKSELANKNKFEQLIAHNLALDEENQIQKTWLDSIREVTEEATQKIQNLQSQSQQLGMQLEELESADKMKDGHIAELTQANKLKDEQIEDLLSQSQLHTEELQRQRDHNLSFQKTLTEQLETYIQQSDRDKKKLAKENDERIQALENKLLDRMIVHDKASSKRIKALEKSSSSQEESTQRIEQIIPTIFQEITDMGNSFDTMQTDMTENWQALSKSITEGKENRTLKPIQDRSRRKTVAL